MTVKKLVIAASILVASTVGVFAADMAVKARPVAPPIVTYNWTGCYIGGNVGGGWAKTEQTRVTRLGVVAVADYGSSEDSNFIGGAQIGCDYQFAGNWVVGMQGMFDFGDIDSSHTLPAFPAFTSVNTTKNIFTVTGRLGYLFAPQVLGYVKGGGAWARVDHNILLPAGAGLSESATGIDRQGWTVGGGVEWMFAPGWSVFGEYNYMDFGRKDIGFVSALTGGGFVAGAPSEVVSTRLTAQQALVGVNYKFNFGGPAVVAKY
jgi:outer membrane immunogenic protein